MTGSKRRLLMLGAAATVFAGVLIGWTAGLVEADLIDRAESVVFLALVILFLATLIGTLIEFKRVDWRSN